MRESETLTRYGDRKRQMEREMVSEGVKSG